MKIEIGECGHLVLKEVFTGVVLETDDGHKIGIAMRDDTFEISVLPKGWDESRWFRVDMHTREIVRMGDRSRSGPAS